MLKLHLSAAAGLLGCGLLSVGTGCAEAQTPPASAQAGQCFDISERTGVVAVNDHTILMRVDADVYKVTTERCPGLTHSDPRIRVILPGSSFVCGKLDYSLAVGETGVPGSNLPCLVQSQRRLTPEEVATLPKGQRP